MLRRTMMKIISVIMGDVQEGGQGRATTLRRSARYCVVGRAGCSLRPGGGEEVEENREWVVPNPPPVEQSSLSAAEKLVQKYTVENTSPPEDCCPICLCSLQEAADCFSDDETDLAAEGVVKLTQCGHSLHKSCARMIAESKQYFIPCPICKSVHGVRCGNQPDGIMEVRIVDDSLPSFEECGTIVITYRFGGGIQGQEHPNPGQPYRAHAFPRRAFLPNNERGNKILQLLQVAWYRRLIFTVGTSITSGLTNVITWNEIHHKTEWEDFSGHGYPDPGYLDNVTMELEHQGVTEADLESQKV